MNKLYLRKVDKNSYLPKRSKLTLTHSQKQEKLLELYKELNIKRKDIELTDKEIEILKALKTLGFEFLARDMNFDLYAYKDKPYKLDDEWVATGIIYLIVGFDFIKWSDDEPTNIDDLLK